MPIVVIDPEEGQTPVLKSAGRYGSGQLFEADVTTHEFIFPCAPGEGPGYDKQCERGSYGKLTTKINYDGTMYFARNWFLGAKLLTQVRNLGVAVEGNQFDTDDVVNRKCIAEVKDPRPRADGDGFWPGDLAAVFGL